MTDNSIIAGFVSDEKEPINNVKGSALPDFGNLTITYAKVNISDKYGESARMLFRTANGDAIGCNIQAIQPFSIVKEFGDKLKNCVVVFKQYTTTNGNTTLKMFAQSTTEEFDKAYADFVKEDDKPVKKK